MRYISLCSGVEAASLAWIPLGWEPVAYAEFDQFPSAVLAARFPGTQNLGDITQVDWKEYHGAADLVVFGSPCQSYSVSGLRKGLADPRGQLMLECLAACRDIDPEWIVFENVPGLLSSHDGGDFQTFLNAVAILWPRGSVAWRILDSQWFGVAQRRRRVFAVINTRDWRRAPAVLLDEHCLLGNTPTREEAWQEVAARAGERPEPGGTEGQVTAFKWFAGAKARTMPAYDDGTTPTLTNSDSDQPAVSIAKDVLCMASGQANAEILRGGLAPTIAARNYKDPPILLEQKQPTARTSSQASVLQTEASSSSTTSRSTADAYSLFPDDET